MNDMLKKIIEMDEQARLVKEQANKEKIATENEIIDTKKKIYDDYISRAKERVNKNLEIDKANAEKNLEDTIKNHAAIILELEKNDKENHSLWVNTIVSRVKDN